MRHVLRVDSGVRVLGAVYPGVYRGCIQGYTEGIAVSWRCPGGVLAAFSGVFNGVITKAVVKEARRGKTR